MILDFIGKKLYCILNSQDGYFVLPDLYELKKLCHFLYSLYQKLMHFDDYFT